MKSKTSFFNSTLFLNLLKRCWPIFAGYFIVWLIILPVSLANTLSYNTAVMGENFNLLSLATAAGRQILSAGLYGGVIMSGIFGVLVAMAAFGYLYNARSVSMMCSLPIKREGVFLSVFTSGLSTMLVSNIIVFLTALLVEAAYGLIPLGGAYLLQWLAMVCLTNLFFFGFASLCASFTGNIFTLPLVYVVLNFTAYVVEFLVKTVMSLFIYGISMDSNFTFLTLSPPVYLFMQTYVADSIVPTGETFEVIGRYYNGWLALGIYAAVGIVFTILAMVVIKRRRMEAAGDVVALKPLKPIFKYCLSVGCALVLGIIIYETAFNSPTSIYGVRGMLFMLLFMLFGAFIGYFAAEMLMNKTLRVFSGRSWIGLGVTAVLISALMLCGEYDVFGIEKRLPNADDVKGVSIMCSGETVVFEEPDNIKSAIELQRGIIEHKDKNEVFTGNMDASANYVSFVYTYKNGKTLSRDYTLYQDATDDVFTLNGLMNVKEAVDYRKSLEIPVSINTIADAYVSYFDKIEMTYRDFELSPEQAYALYTECIVPDIDDGTLGKIWLVQTEDYYNGVYDCTINFSVEQRLSDNNYKGDYFYTTLTTTSERTKKWISDNLDIEPCTMGESQAILYSQSDYKVYKEKAAAVTYSVNAAG